MSSATESYKDQMRTKLQECKSRVGVTDVALKLGYRVDKSAGVNKYVEMILGAPAEPSDRIIIHVKCDKASQTYFRRNNTKGDVVTLIKENLHAFHATGNTEWSKIMSVLADMANMPMTDYKDAEMIHRARTAGPMVFDPSRYDVRPMENGAAMPAIFAARGFNSDTFNAFRPFVCEIRDRSNDSFKGYNIGFPYRVAGQDQIEGYEIRGSKGFKSKAAGTNSSTAAWIADFSNDNPLGVKDVFFMESASGGVLFSTVITSISWMRDAFAVMRRKSSGSFSLASMALSRAFPKMALISKGSKNEPSLKWMTALKSIFFSFAACALSRMMMSRNSFPV